MHAYMEGRTSPGVYKPTEPCRNGTNTSLLKSLGLRWRPQHKSFNRETTYTELSKNRSVKTIILPSKPKEKSITGDTSEKACNLVQLGHRYIATRKREPERSTER